MYVQKVKGGYAYRTLVTCLLSELTLQDVLNSTSRPVMYSFFHGVRVNM